MKLCILESNYGNCSVICISICIDTYMPFYFHAQESFGSGCEVCTVRMMFAHSEGFLSTLPLFLVPVCVWLYALAVVCCCFITFVFLFRSVALETQHSKSGSVLVSDVAH
jgi:hypothetical protein